MELNTCEHKLFNLTILTVCPILILLRKVNHKLHFNVCNGQNFTELSVWACELVRHVTHHKFTTPTTTTSTTTTASTATASTATTTSKFTAQFSKRCCSTRKCFMSLFMSLCVKVGHAHRNRFIGRQNGPGSFRPRAESHPLHHNGEERTRGREPVALDHWITGSWRRPSSTRRESHDSVQRLHHTLGVSLAPRSLTNWCLDENN